jgi:small subunit ribosomal protein S1
MLDASGAGPRRRYAVGEKIAGKIIQLGHDVAFLELGSGIAEGMIDVSELKDEDGNVTAREGDIVDGVVVQSGDRGVVISKGHGKAPTRDHAREAVIEASRTGLPVEGMVKGVNKGGLEVEIHGVRAFCPVSQIDVRFVGDPASFVGQKLQFSRRSVPRRRAPRARSSYRGRCSTASSRRSRTTGRSWISAASRASCTYRSCRGTGCRSRRSSSTPATRSRCRCSRSSRTRGRASG